MRQARRCGSAPRCYRWLLTMSMVLACDVEPVGLGPTGISDLDVMPNGDCGRGFLVASSDYQSSNISALDRRGNILSPSLVSSAYAAAGLVLAFSGDVVFPTERQRGDEAIFIDRFPQSVVTFLNLRDATLRAQLDVSTGFRANPHDTSTLEDGTLLLTRFDSNPNAGSQRLDGGGDLLLLDPTAPKILARIALDTAIPGASSRMLPHPERMLRVGARVFVVVALYSPDFRQTGASFLVTIDTASLTVVDAVEIAGLKGCAGIALAPNGAEVAVACSGSWGSKNGADPDSSGLVGFDITGLPVQTWQLLATTMTPAQPFGFTVAYADRTHVLGVALGRNSTDNNPSQSDRFVSYDVKAKKLEVLHSVAGRPFSLGDVRCFSECGRCALANADGRGSVMLFQASDSEVHLDAEVTIDDQLGLPPRWLGTF